MGKWHKGFNGALLSAAVVALAGCGTPFATMPTRAGDEVMLLGHDPVAYFSLAKPMRGDPAIKSTLPGRTYYFLSTANKQLFDAQPARYEPQYGGFCASGAAFALKLGSDPTEWHIVNEKLYIFGDIMGRMAWELDPAWNIRYGDQTWPEARDQGWRGQTLSRYADKVAWYKNTGDIAREFAAKYSGKPMPKYDVGTMSQNLFTKRPGWRAREGHGGQPELGLVGEDACPPACVGQVSKAFGEP